LNLLPGVFPVHIQSIELVVS